MNDSPNFEALDAKHGRNRQERLTTVVRWAEYVRDQPPEVWGPQQNAVVDSQLESAQATGLRAEHLRRVEGFVEEAGDDRDD
jgi:hypothetical protein